ncbi:MAG: hypothetical protein Roseis2KO_12360 [Roseivirga sp.]
MGIGLVHFENDFTTLLKFYDRPDDSSVPVFSANLIYDSTEVGIKTTLKKEGELKFRPLYTLIGRSVAVLRVMHREGEWLRVVTDEISQTEHWLRSPESSIESWPDFLKSVYHVGPKQADENPLRKSPGNGEVLLERFDITCFSITQVQEDWIRVLNEPDNCDGPLISSYPYAGFLRWKKNGRVLINFAL